MRSLSGEDDIGVLHHRVIFIMLVVLAFVIIVLVRLYYLQIVRGGDYRLQSDQISVREEEVRAPRGVILDRNGRVLASNKPDFEIVLLRQDIRDKARLIKSITNIIPITEEEINKKIAAAQSQPAFMPVLLVDGAPYDWIARIKQYQRAEYDDDTPVYLEGLEIRATTQRIYPYPELFSHVIGYLKEVDQKGLDAMSESHPDKYSRGDYVGASGVEYAYDAQLKGQDGMKARVVDARGKEVKGGEDLQLMQERLSFLPVAGKTLVTTLDYEAQEAAAKELGDRRGAVVAIDPNNGDVLVMYSSPNYDPNRITKNIDREYWKLINTDEHKYLYNRAIQAMYPPGSTYKIVPVFGGLDSGKIKPDTHFGCSGGMQFGSRYFQCWNKGGHGHVEVVRALTQSCDVFFYRTGLALGVDGLHHYADLLGLGKKTGIEIPFEQPGLIPSEAWKLKRYKAPWIESETMSVSIGQGYNLVTPLQNARMIAMVANGGRLFKPRLGKFILNEFSEKENEFTTTFGEPVIKPEVMKYLKEGLIGVVHGAGTARRLAASRHKIAGKTGTAQVTGYESKIQKKDHALFVSMAPYDNPKIAVSVIVENGGHGGSDAAPVALAVTNAYLDKLFPQEVKEQEMQKSVKSVKKPVVPETVRSEVNNLEEAD